LARPAPCEPAAGPPARDKRAAGSAEPPTRACVEARRELPPLPHADSANSANSANSVVSTAAMPRRLVGAQLMVPMMADAVLFADRRGERNRGPACAERAGGRDRALAR